MHGCRQNTTRAAALFLLLLLTGCGGIEMYGKPGMYIDNPDPIEVHLPENAPHISAEFSPPMGSNPGHGGMDVWAKLGTPVIAAAPGRMEQSYYEPMYGNHVIIDHGTDETGMRVLTEYKHLHDRLAEPGDMVRRGQQIGTMGATGFLGMAVHLHFEVQRGTTRLKARPLDPHLFWADGIGMVTCFDASKTWPDRPFATTYPVPCKGL